MKKPVLIVILTSTSLLLWSQAKTRRLPSTINHPTINLYAPYVSHDGNALLYLSDTGEDGSLVLSYTSRETDWSTPTEMPRHLHSRLNFLKGYALNADGKRMYFTSIKSPSVGGYDVFMSEQKGTAWTPGENLGMPVNSRAHEASPSLSSDGNSLYFMRCDKMDMNKAEGCKIFKSDKKQNGQWAEPVELPANINTGNSQSPRIMADGETLIFSSDKNGGKGGMDLFVSKYADGKWANPKSLDFANTEKDDQYVSASALGRYLLKEAPSPRNKYELTEFLIPDDIRPKGMMKIEGTISDVAGAPVGSYISVLDLNFRKRVYNGRPGTDGNFFVYLKEGAVYELSVDPEQNHLTYYCKTFDLTGDKIPQKEKITVQLKQPAPGDEIILSQLSFKPSSDVITTGSTNELDRLARLIKANPTIRFEVQVLLKGYAEDSIRSDPDLTELTIDSLTTSIERMDSTGVGYQLDTTIVYTTYHNDRTLKQAQAVITYLVSQGVPEKNLIYFVNAVPAILPEEKLLTIKAVVRN